MAGQKLTFEEYADRVRRSVESIGFSLLSEVVSSRTNIAVRCGFGHEFSVRPTNWERDPRCVACDRSKRLAAKAAQFREELAQGGCEMLGDFQNSKIKVLARCDRGHEFSIRPNDWRSGVRCGVCAGWHRNPEDLRRSMAAEKYEMLSEYCGATTKVQFRCPKGHRHAITPSHWGDGIRCGKCCTSIHNQYAQPSRAAVLKRHRGDWARNVGGKLPEYIVQHLESISLGIDQMYRDCPPGFHVDHVVPFREFDRANLEAISACWNPANLRYIPGHENLARGSRMTAEEVSFVRQNHPEIWKRSIIGKNI